MNYFKNFLAIVSSVIVVVMAYGLCNAVGNWYVGLLRKQEGFINSSDIIAYRYIVPGFLALIAGGAVLFFYGEKKGGGK